MIKHFSNELWYIKLPFTTAQDIEFKTQEIVKWVIQDKQRMTIQRILQVSIKTSLFCPLSFTKYHTS